MKLPALKEIVEERKEKAIETLSARFAENRLPLEEYERLVEYINKIESERELVIVENMVAGFGGDERSEKENKEDSGPRASWTNEERGVFRSIRNHISFLSNRSFSGPLRSGDQFFTFMGNQEIYVRELRPGRTELRVVTLMGNLEVHVAPGIRVRVDAFPLMGNVEIRVKEERKKIADGEPELVIAGTAIMGNIDIVPLED